MENKTQVIVVGAGPSGVSAAITLARAGKKVILVDRADNVGDKNMFGGAIYTPQTIDVFPNFQEEAPLERAITEQRIIMLKDNDSIQFGHKTNTPKINGYSVNRSKWDKWCVEQAKKEGVVFAPKTLVKELIIQNNKVIGIKTEIEEYYADIVILADGVNSLLAKQIGLRKDIKDSDVTVNVKEVYKLSKDKLQERFNIGSNEGVAAKILGGPLKDMFAIGFMYTNKETISIGLGIALEDLKKIEIRPHELLDSLKEHPSIAPFIKDAELIEYSSHLIPEGGFNSIPKLYANGVLIIGDAAMLVNNIHFEGTNFATLSGKLAAVTAIEAIDKNDFSEKTLSLYKKELERSIILKDLKTHKDTIPFIKKHISTITTMYPEFICEFFRILTNADEKPKSKIYNEFLFKILKSGVILKTIPLGIFAMGKCIKK